MLTFSKRSVLWLTIFCVLGSGLAMPGIASAAGPSTGELKKLDREIDQYLAAMKKKKHHKHHHHKHHKKHHHKKSQTMSKKTSK